MPTSFKFLGSLTPVDRKFMKWIILVPDEILGQLPGQGRVRTKGTMNGAPFSLAIQSLGTGEKYFAVSAGLRRSAKMSEGHPVVIEFAAVDPDLVELPEELEAVLEQDEEAMRFWKGLTPGMQRGLAHYVGSVKNVDSRIKRAFEIINKAKARKLHFQLTARKKG